MDKTIDKFQFPRYNSKVYDKWYACRRWITCLEHISLTKENGKKIMASETE